MSGFFLILVRASLCGSADLANAPAEVILDLRQARVTSDAGLKGNLKGPNLPDPGDELGWRLREIPPASMKSLQM